MSKGEAGKAAVEKLIQAFHANREDYIKPGSSYNETQLRSDFLNPFLEALGWDVLNKKGAPQHVREVVHEITVGVDEDDKDQLPKRPDYALRVGGKKKLFVEAKKPSVSIETDKKPSFQIRRYGWSARMAVSVLSNFDQLAIYDCRPQPKPDDEALIARIALYHYTDYIDKFDEIYDKLSRESVYSGRFDQIFGAEEDFAGTASFDQYFLKQIERWRLELARDLVQRNPALKQKELNFLLQRLLNRIIFLRICEDRTLEKYQALLEVKTYDDLKQLFETADQRYNSDLFDFIQDQLSLEVEIGSDVLVGIFRELYYPESPYAFSVVEPSVLGDIYELFLGGEVVLNGTAGVQVVDKPEVVESGGVVPTPRYIVDEIVERSLSPLCQDKTPDELLSLRIIDISCGSGSFLLGAYEYLLNYHLEWYLKDDAKNHPNSVYEGVGGQWHLTLQEKQRILRNGVYGVDIDVRAVEVTRFSLLLKVLEGESRETIDNQLDPPGMRALPNLTSNVRCGNSLTDEKYSEYDDEALTNLELFESINPLDWSKVFPSIIQSGGFDAIIGNPPYIRIQKMVKYSPEEIEYYQSPISPYTCAKGNNFDKYFLFIERGLSLLKSSGRLGFIVPHKFFTIKAGKALRELITSGGHLAEIVHFGVQQVFGNKSSTYTCLLFLVKQGLPAFSVEHVTDLDSWRRGSQGAILTYESKNFDDREWVFVSHGAQQLFERLRAENPTVLKDVANVFVGMQTSADKIYIIHPKEQTDTLVVFDDLNGDTHAVEKAILRPCLHDVSLEPFGTPVSNAYMLFPYRIQGGKAVVYSQEEMASKFPQCWIYLSAHKEALKERSISGGTPNIWYRYGRSQSLTKFDGSPKLVWPVLSLEPRYTYDEQGICVTGGGNGPYYALRPHDDTILSIYYLQAVLSHPVIEAMVRARSSKFRGGYGSHGKQFIVDLPIRTIDFSVPEEKAAHDQIVKFVESLIKATDDRASVKTPQERDTLSRQCSMLREKIEQKVGQLYGINPDDLEVVKDLTTPSEESI